MLRKIKRRLKKNVRVTNRDGQPRGAPDEKRAEINDLMLSVRPKIAQMIERTEINLKGRRLNMERTEFFAKVEEILDSNPGSVSAESIVQDQEGWDSVAALSLIAMIDESYGVSLEGTEIFACPTVGELFGLVQQRANAA